MEVNILDRRGLVAQPRFEEIVDVRHFSIEEIVAFERQPDLLRQLVSDLAVEDRCRLRLHATVLDQRARTEVPEPESRKCSRSYSGGRVYGKSSRDHSIKRARHERFVLWHVEKAGV